MKNIISIHEAKVKFIDSVISDMSYDNERITVTEVYEKIINEDYGFELPFDIDEDDIARRL